tara:strand:+ start:100 stop:519 length:420 start_codon:yes stop_codon:yes gene_type:complete
VIKKKNISQVDIDAWQDYIKNPTDIVDKDVSKILDHSNNSRFKYDLHGYSLVDANKRVEEIILSCAKKKYKEILLITGKGIHSNTDKDIYVSKKLSKLKYSVPEFINSNSDLSKHVISVSNADEDDGGSGAIIIKLKKL